MRRIGALLGVAALTLAGAAVAVAQSAPAEAAVAGLVRVDQVGYLPSDGKLAYLMTSAPVHGVTFTVVDSSGHAVLSGQVGGVSRRAWNARYPDVYPIAFSGLTRPGRYRIRVGGAASGVSPEFAVAGPDALYGHLVADAVSFFQAQRDGADVIAGALQRAGAGHDG